jgi:hypothetical protein
MGVADRQPTAVVAVDGYRLRRRTADVGFKIEQGSHVLHVTGITAYLKAGGTPENAQAMAAHEDPDSAALGRDRSHVVLGAARRWSDHHAQSRRTVLAHARGAVKLCIPDSFRPNGPDGMWLISGESVRRVEQDSRHAPEHGKLPVEPDGGLTQCSQYRV